MATKKKKSASVRHVLSDAAFSAEPQSRGKQSNFFRSASLDHEVVARGIGNRAPTVVAIASKEVALFIANALNDKNNP